LHHEHSQQGIEHTGSVVFPDQRWSAGEKIRRVTKFVKSVTAEEMLNRMEYL